MCNRVNILFVDNQQTTYNEFLQLSENYNWHITFCNNSFLAIQEIKQNSNYSLLLINYNVGPLKPNQFIDYLSTELNINIPAILIKDVNNNEFDDEDVFMSIATPITQKEIEKIEIYLNGKATQQSKKQNVYSLNYLKNLSDDNSEFILESLSVFKTSVSDKLEDLKQALSLFNYKETREIAHNIKPSFEMLENENGRILCDNICHHAKEESISDLADELNEEYEKIINQLKKDFPKLN